MGHRRLKGASSAAPDRTGKGFQLFIIHPPGFRLSSRPRATREYIPRELSRSRRFLFVCVCVYVYTLLAAVQREW